MRPFIIAMKPKIILSLSSLLVFLLLVSCDAGSRYPALLVEADSAMMSGKYDLADSLLIAYDGNRVDAKHDVQMYRQLLDIEQKYVGGKLSESDFPMADSLRRYYEDNGRAEEHAKSLLFCGYLYSVNDDWPMALRMLLDAKPLCESLRNPHLSCWLNQDLGDLYFYQRMFTECIPYYRQYYSEASAIGDTLRMGYSSIRMGRAYTILTEADSAICCYRAALDYGEKSHSDVIVSHARHNLCDLYIQLGRYDVAQNIMTTEPQDTDNRAYWNLGRHNNDSALHYFHQMLGQYGWYAESNTLHEIARLEAEREHYTDAVSYYEQSIAAADSFTQSSQVEETKRIAAQQKYAKLKESRDRATYENKVMRFTLLIIALAVILLLSSIVFLWLLERRRKNAVADRERLLRYHKERRTKVSPQHLRCTPIF